MGKGNNSLVYICRITRSDSSLVAFGYFHCVTLTIQFSCAILTCLVLLYVLLQSLPTNTPAFALFSKLKHITLKSIRDN